MVFAYLMTATEFDGKLGGFGSKETDFGGWNSNSGLIRESSITFVRYNVEDIFKIGSTFLRVFLIALEIAKI